MGGINSIRNREAGRTNCCVKGREKEKNKKNKKKELAHVQLLATSRREWQSILDNG